MGIRFVSVQQLVLASFACLFVAAFLQLHALLVHSTLLVLSAACSSLATWSMLCHGALLSLSTASLEGLCDCQRRTGHHHSGSVHFKTAPRTSFRFVCCRRQSVLESVSRSVSQSFLEHRLRLDLAVQTALKTTVHVFWSN